VNGETGGDHMAGHIFGTVNARHLCNGPTQIHQIYRKYVALLPAQNGGNIVSIF